MKKLATLIMFLGLLAPACAFDSSGLPADDDECTEDCDDDDGPSYDGPDVMVPVDPGTEPVTCDSHADCDDDVACTVNRCMEGVCRAYENPEQTCECTVDADCDDGDAATSDACVDYACVNEEVPACEAAADCDDGLSCTDDYCTDGVCENLSVCNGGEICTAEFDACAPDGAECVEDDHCDDSNAGTDDYCVDNACEHWANGTVCGDNVCEGGEDHASCPSDCSDSGAPLTIDCADIDGVTVTISGNIREGLAPDWGDLPGTPEYVTFGANHGANGWPSSSTDPDPTLPSCDVVVDDNGTPSDTDDDVWTCSGTIGFGDSVQEFNFYVVDDSGELRYFKLPLWELAGECFPMSTGGGICTASTTDGCM